MPDASHPRVTIVSSNPMRDDSCNGILLRSLFSGWPRERLFQVYFRVVVPHVPTGGDCEEYRAIGITGSSRRVRSADADISAPGGISGSAPGSTRRQQLSRSLRRTTGLFRWLRWGYELCTARPAMARALERQLEELSPDIVYALLGTYSLTKITFLACERLGLPLFVHVTDDFVSALYEQGPFAARMQAASESWFRRAVRRADGLAAIGPAMAEEYGRRYGREWSWFTTLIDADDYDPSPTAGDGPIRLVYAGSLSLGRWESLGRLARALETLRVEDGLESRLVICCSDAELREHRPALEVPPITELRGWVPPQELPGLFHDADILVHVESFRPAFASYTSLSLSTKLSQYMMAGRCILAIGPAQLGSIRAIRDIGAAFAITESSAEALRSGLHRLFADGGTRRELAQRGRDWAARNLHRCSGRERFRREIIAALRRASESRGREPAA